MHNHGYEIMEGEGIAGGEGITGQMGAKRKNWDNSNSIINKIYFKKERSSAFMWQQQSKHNRE